MIKNSITPHNYEVSDNRNVSSSNHQQGRRAWLVALAKMGFEPVHFLADLIDADSSCLDIGAGTGNTAILLEALGKSPRTMVALEVFPSYARVLHLNDLYDEVIIGDARYLPFRQDSFSAVLAFDVIEHLEREEGCQLIRDMMEVAESRIAIMTPNGFLPQQSFDKNAFQEHHSGWTIADFGYFGFEVLGVRGLKRLWRIFSGRTLITRILLYGLAAASQPIAQRLPRYAFQLYATRHKNSQLRLQLPLNQGP